MMGEVIWGVVWVVDGRLMIEEVGGGVGCVLGELSVCWRASEEGWMVVVT